MPKNKKGFKFDKLAKPEFTKPEKKLNTAEENKKEYKEKEKEKKQGNQTVEGVELHPALKYKGKGGLGGEYLFEGIAGSVVAGSLKEAFVKANEIATKHSNLLVK